MWTIPEAFFRKAVRCKGALLLLMLAAGLSGCGRISDGEYAASVSLEGGSGKAYIESPCRVTVQDGKATADILWSSPFYDYMIVDGVRYEPVSVDGNSEFEIPILPGEEMQIQADTTAMSTPHLIDYTVTFTLLTGEEAVETEADTGDSEWDRESISDMTAPDIPGFGTPVAEENDYATGFRIYRYPEGDILIAVRDGRNYLLVPEGGKEADTALEGVSVFSLPLKHIYLAASAVMSQFDSIGAVDRVSFVATKREDWYIDSVLNKMDEGTLRYGGKYSAPDYEALLAADCDAAIENTMILHSPKVTEKLEKLGIPVFIDWSSYEESVFGRLEWIRVYGLLTGHEKEAQQAYEEQLAKAAQLTDKELSGKRVAVFSVNANHQIVTKNENDYLVKMIEEAGGIYLMPTESADSSRSQMTIGIEAFQAYARDADVLIYNGVIEDPPETLRELMAMDVTFSELPAMQQGEVWCVDKSLYQYTSRTGDIMESIYQVLTNGEENTEFLYKLK